MEEAKHVKKQNFSFIKSIGISLIIVVFLRTFFFTNYIVEGESMMPTLEDGNLLMVNKIGIKIGELERFDIVVFHKNKDEDFVKRVIGLPGDHIEYRDDNLYVNGKGISEPYLKDFKDALFVGQLTGDFTLEEITGESIVPEDHIFVIGDNRLDSWDSRHFGFIKMEQVVGKVNIKYWPFDKMGILD
ncbi:signal peptidase I [Bacillus sinesaloumensis]|uniref:signal peptidase I n=1 Tax=Litchfieldia sinesaloumensis TaxID=1926280 RepID=UPI0009886473|nr:signal peptidase I [Bacillus sinesaloumensis]